MEKHGIPLNRGDTRFQDRIRKIEVSGMETPYGKGLINYSNWYSTESHPTLPVHLASDPTCL